MPRFKDRTGDRHGRLIVISHAGKDHRKKHLWLCTCDCGNSKVVVSDNLSSGKSKSCGCLKVEFLARSGNQYGLSADRESALIKVQYSHIKRRNKQLGHIECMPLSTFAKLIKSPCRYCGIGSSKEIEDRLNESKSKKRMSDHILKCNGIDRINSDLGYTVDNSTPCCKLCNFAKHTMTEVDFYSWVKRVYEHNFK